MRKEKVPGKGNMSRITVSGDGEEARVAGGEERIRQPES